MASGPRCDVKVGVHPGPYWVERIKGTKVCDRHRSHFEERSYEFGPFVWVRAKGADRGDHDAAPAEVNSVEMLTPDRDRLAAEVEHLRAEVAEARNAASEALGCRFIHDQCDCGDTVACGVCHMVERLRLLRDGDAKTQEADRGFGGDDDRG